MNFGPLEEKPEGAGGISATRTVALMFAVTICYAIVRMANQDHAHDVGWPFVALGVVTLLAVPVQALFKLVNKWLTTKPGAKLLDRLIEKVVPGLTTGGGPDVTTTTTVQTKDTE